ncbi:MAG: precorrin-3B C(17)-methyltransferase [Leptolyngbyaceae cyanobacterium T60_A2020_046]|nr:precorrin-3B C(17)-methyltransferase [Leptolyngbyaceae cyanobacterium T60_A2020_046]
MTKAEPWRATGVDLRDYAGPLRETVADLWPTVEGFVFGLATGAVVRLIAPLLADKATDPAVVVVDEAGQFAISLCGGHQGGGDRLAQVVSQTLSATPVLTGAAHHHGIVGVDVLGEPFGWAKGSGDWTGVASAIARKQPIQVIQEAGSTLWWDTLPTDHGWQRGWADPTDPTEARPQPAARVWISPIQRQFSPTAEIPKVQWHPRVLWVGVGCERGTSAALIEQAIAAICEAHHLAMVAIAGLATLDLKADEAGLLAVCEARGWPLRCFAPEVLRPIAVPNPSPVVEQAVGTPSVAEAAAIAAACNPMNLQTPPITDEPPLLRVTKHVWRQPDQPGAVTIAIAQAEQEFTDRPGHLWLVGTGPGRLDQITPAVKAAIAQADAVVGYQLYVDLIRPLLRSGQIVEAMPITQEQQRADRAIALAQQGLSVAVISSGDCGIYAMAGLVFETLAAQDWPGHSPTVEVLPGISALQATASRVGAPLMHDFCAISLSDLLTPWPVIEKRLQAAAAADFVVALYNPKSQKRTEQIAIAQRIFAHHRPPETPVAIVRAAYRPDEHITLTTVQDLLTHPIDMLSTVLIGNSSTRLHAGYMLTPRGYPVSVE